MSPGGIDCGTTCSYSYASGTPVTLAAAAGPGSTFAGWTGACTGTGSCTLTMAGPTSVGAVFNTTTTTMATPTAYTLTVKKEGNGKGTVESTPGGIACGRDCSERYDVGAVITLTATPANSATVFAGWGGACTGTGTCTVTLNQSASATASFKRLRR